MLVEMKQKDIATLKKKLYDDNNKICPILKIEVPLEKMTLDHIHKLKSEECSEQRGTVRNAIEFRANSLEGKISNMWKRYFGADEENHPITLPDFLRNLADYIEAGAYCDEEGNYYIHPTEVKREPNLSKRSYNKLKKLHEKSSKKGKFPDYPKSKKLTKSLKKLYDDFEIEPEFMSA